MAQQPETRFKAKVQSDLQKLRETWFCKIQQMTICGTPDFLICANGYFIALELKSEKGQTSKLQEYNLHQIRKCGGFSFVAMPENWEDIYDNIQQLIGE